MAIPRVQTHVFALAYLGVSLFFFILCAPRSGPHLTAQLHHRRARRVEANAVRDVRYDAADRPDTACTASRSCSCRRDLAASADALVLPPAVLVRATMYNSLASRYSREFRSSELVARLLLDHEQVENDDQRRVAPEALDLRSSLRLQLREDGARVGEGARLRSHVVDGVVLHRVVGRSLLEQVCPSQPARGLSAH